MQKSKQNVKKQAECEKASRMQKSKQNAKAIVLTGLR